MSEARTLDCRGLACPLPVLKTREALGSSTEAFTVLVDNEAAAINVTRFAESQGASATAIRQAGDLVVTVRPGPEKMAGLGGSACADDASPSIPSELLTCSAAPSRNLVVYIASEGMGSGDEALGRILMAAFLDTLAQWKDDLSHVIFVNGGAKLAARGSPVLDQIRQLEQVGATVLVCGTCLRHFGIEKQLAVGSVSNMFAILDVLTRAGRIIRP